MNKIIAFDFDGTLADTLDILVNITNDLSAQFGYEKINKDEIMKLQQLNSWQIFKLSGLGIHQLPCLLQKVRLGLKAEMPKAQLFPQIKEVLVNLKSQGNKLGIITSNSRDNVLTLMANNELISIFDFIYSDASLFGKQKLIKQCLKLEKFPPEDVIYVGDEVRDIRAARKAGIKVIAVSWGFNLPSILAANQPDYLIEKPEDLLAIIE